MIKSSSPYFTAGDIEKIVSDVREILESGQLLFGEYTRKFEQMFAKYVKAKHAIETNSGTSALEIALRCLEVKNGAEVIVPTNTFIASPNSVIFAGGKPVFADIERETLCIDVEDAKERLTDKTIGIMAVHIAGLISPTIDDLRELCEDHHLFLIEDAAHAHGAMFKGEMAGNLGDVGCFSFYPTKVMTTGEGGMICTNMDKIAEKAKVLRYDGISNDGLIREIGYNWHPSEFHSAIGIYQLLRLEEFIKKRNDIARLYENRLRKISGISLFHRPSNIRHAYYKFPILLEPDINAEDLMKNLKEKHGVETGRVYYPPCHMQPLYKRLFGFKEGAFPVAEDVLSRVITLPMHAGMRTNEIDYVLENLESTINEC